MAEQDKQDSSPHIPQAAGAFQLHGPLTEAERQEQEHKRREEEYRREENAFKERQITISAGQLVTNQKIARYTAILAILGLIGNSIAILATNAARTSADAATAAANEAIKQSKAAAASVGAAQDALALARDNFRQDQRPYLWLTKDGSGAPQFVPHANNPNSTTGQVLWTWHYTNFGKSPAHDIHNVGFIQIGNEPMKRSYVTPSATPERSTVGIPMPPGADYFNTVISDPGMTRERFASLMDQRSQTTIRIRVVLMYSDAYRQSYETRVCLERLNLGGIVFCEGSTMK